MYLNHLATDLRLLQYSIQTLFSVFSFQGITLYVRELDQYVCLCVLMIQGSFPLCMTPLTCIARFAALVKNLSEDVLSSSCSRRRRDLLFFVVVLELMTLVPSTAHASSPIPRPLSTSSWLGSFSTVYSTWHLLSLKIPPAGLPIPRGRPPIQIQTQI